MDNAGHRIPIFEAKKPQNTVTLRMKTVRTVPDKGNPGKHCLRFTYDAQVPGSISLILFPNNDICDVGDNEIFTVDVEQGRTKVFTQPPGTGIDLSIFESDEVPSDGVTPIHPLAIETVAFSDSGSGSTNFQITYVTFEKERGEYRARVVRQVSVVDGDAYEMQPTFGSENFDTKKLDEKSENDTCVVCKEKFVDTLLKPCNHACLCLDCAQSDWLRKSRKCPICRAEVEGLE